ncbi:MAG: hypothetical protein ACFFAE_12445 [Candidatus Hodarchaeota archaeon]
MSKQNQDRLKLEEVNPTPPILPLVISLFIVTGRFKRRKRRRY